MDEPLNDIKKKSKRKIICQDFHNPNRSSLSDESVLKSSTKQKHKATKSNNLDFLPKMDLMETDIKKKSKRKIRCLDFHNPNRSSLAEKTLLKSSTKKTRKATKPKNLDYLPKIDLLENDKEHSLDKNIGKWKCSSRLRQSVSFKSNLSKEFVEESLKPQEASLQVTCEQNSPEITYSRRCTRKSVRFLTPSPSKKNTKRNTFDLETSTVDRSLLPNITKDECANHPSYKKSPHVQKFKTTFIKDESSFDYGSDSVIEDKSVDHSKISTCMDNIINTSKSIPKLQKNEDSKKLSLSKTTPKLQTKVPIRNETEPCKRISQKTPKSQNLSLSVIDLVTPDSEKLSDTLQSIQKNSLVHRNSIITSGLLLNVESKNSILNQLSTFTIEQTTPKNKKLKDLTCNFDSSIVSKRRKWDKSQDCSFLDSISNISAPWTNTTFQLSVSNGDNSKTENSLSKNTPTRNKYTIHSKICNKAMNKIISPTTTSTPVVKLAQKNTSKEKPKVKIDESKNIKSIIKTNMPNFARIHQRAYEKLENIREMSERKATRAQLLLSGHKPEPGLPLPTKPHKSKKELIYSPIKISKLTSGIPKVIANVATKVEVMLPSTSNPKVITLPKPTLTKAEPSKLKSLIPKPVNDKHLKENNGLSRFGFKVKNTTKDEQVKAVVQKSRVISDPVQKRRNVIQNVRSNRRFELLMQMRKK